MSNANCVKQLEFDKNEHKNANTKLVQAEYWMSK